MQNIDFPNVAAIKYYNLFCMAKREEENYFLARKANSMPLNLFDCCNIDSSNEYKKLLEELQDVNNPYLIWLQAQVNYKVAIAKLKAKKILRNTSKYPVKELSSISSEIALNAIVARAFYIYYAPKNISNYLLSKAKINDIVNSAKALQNNIKVFEVIRQGWPEKFHGWLNALTDRKFIDEICNIAYFAIKKTRGCGVASTANREICIRYLVRLYVDNFKCKKVNTPDSSLLIDIISIIKCQGARSAYHRTLTKLKKQMS